MSDGSNDVIDTAIVIKNIPFDYPEEDFATGLFRKLNLNPPHAFNYHRNKSDLAFLGVAFANFNSPDEAQAAVTSMNNYVLRGRSLRVELKKRLPLKEERRKRLERDSRRPANQQLQYKAPVAPVRENRGISTGLVDIPLILNDVLEPQLWPKVIVHEPASPALQTGITDRGTG